MDRLILIEGLPGSGKTTFAQMLYQALCARIGNVHLYVEGDLHPADTAWCACLTAEEFTALCIENPIYAADFKENSTRRGDRIVLAYTKVPDLPPALTAFLESREIYDGRVSRAQFNELQTSGWQDFGQTASGLHIFECAFLQNTVNELMLFDNAEEAAILRRLTQLLKTVEHLQPVLIYLDMDASASIGGAAAERIDGDGNRVWEERVAQYICESPYGRAHKLSGIDGMNRYFSERQALERRVLTQLPVAHHVLHMTPESRQVIEAQFTKALIADCF